MTKSKVRKSEQHDMTDIVRDLLLSKTVKRAIKAPKGYRAKLLRARKLGYVWKSWGQERFGSTREGRRLIVQRIAKDMKAIAKDLI